MDEDSEDIHSQNLISYYQCRPKILEKYCLADLAAELRITVPKDTKYESQEFGQIDDDDDDDDDDKAEILDTSEAQEDSGNEKILLHLKNGVLIKQRKKFRIIRYINYNIQTDMEMHYHEHLMLFLPWRNEDNDLHGGYSTYTEHYNSKKQSIMQTCLKYEKHNDSLQEAIEQMKIMMM